MTITPKPKSKDAQASGFIRSAETNGAGKRKLIPVWVKMDEEVLARVDAMARRMGLNRSAFVISAVGEKLHQLESRNK